jgi:hypothetical protein
LGEAKGHGRRVCEQKGEKKEGTRRETEGEKMKIDTPR